MHDIPSLRNIRDDRTCRLAVDNMKQLTQPTLQPVAEEQLRLEDQFSAGICQNKFQDSDGRPDWRFSTFLYVHFCLRKMRPAAKYGIEVMVGLNVENEKIMNFTTK